MLEVEETESEVQSVADTPAQSTTRGDAPFYIGDSSD